MGKKKGPSVDDDGQPYDYIVVIDAGSKGSRANVYRTRQFNSTSASQVNPRSWKESDDETKNAAKLSHVEYPEIVTVNSKDAKKIKPGIADFVNNPKKLRKQYMGKLLKHVLKYIPDDQVYRTPIFLHATGGMRLLKPEDQQRILDEICDYVGSKFDFHLPDCATHINSISGEIEGLYSWIGINYKYGVLNAMSRVPSFGILDMGGVSSQIALEPNITEQDSDDYLFKLHLNYLDQNNSKNSFNVFSESFLGGMNQIHSKYGEILIQQNETTDPCLPKNFVKTITTTKKPEGYAMESQLTGTGQFKECLTSLNSLLTSITTTKSCNLTSSSSSVSSCLLSDSMPFLKFDIKRFIGINGVYSNLKNFLNYSEFYSKTSKLCSTQYTDLLNSETDDRASEMCFKSSWLINVLHNGLGFPRYGIDDDNNEDGTSQIEQALDPLSNLDNSFKILDEFSWTLGRAVLYSYYEMAERQLGERPQVGFVEPSSELFVYGGEALGVESRPIYDFNHVKIYDGGKSNDDDDNDSDDDDDDKDDWDDVLEEHRLWGSLLFLLILLVVGYLLLGRTKRQNIVDTVKKLYHDKFKSRYSVVNNDEPVHELEGVGEQEDEGDVVFEAQSADERRDADRFEV